MSQLSEGRPLFNSLLVTFNKERVKNIKTGKFEENEWSKPHTLQQVVQIGPHVNEVKVKEWIQISPASVERGGIPILELDDTKYAIITERDILYIFGPNKPFDPDADKIVDLAKSSEDIHKDFIDNSPEAIRNNNESNEDFLQRISYKKEDYRPRKTIATDKK